MRLAYEMIPYMPSGAKPKTPTTAKTAEAESLDSKGATTQSVRIDRGGFGVDIQFEKPTIVKLGQNHTILIQLLAPASKPTAAEKIGLKYKLVPFGG